MSVLSSLNHTMTDLFMTPVSVCVLYAKPSLASQSLCSPTVFLDVHLSLSGSTTLGLSASLWTSVYFLLHQSSWLQPPPLSPPDPSPPVPSPVGRPAFSAPLSCFPQTPAVNHLCLSCSPRRPALFLSFAVCTDTQTHYSNMHYNTGTGFIKNKLCMEIVQIVKWKRDILIHLLYLFTIQQAMPAKPQNM